jgi:hypothetical protein
MLVLAFAFHPFEQIAQIVITPGFDVRKMGGSEGGDIGCAQVLAARHTLRHTLKGRLGASLFPYPIGAIRRLRTAAADEKGLHEAGQQPHAPGCGVGDTQPGFGDRGLLASRDTINLGVAASTPSVLHFGIEGFALCAAWLVPGGAGRWLWSGSTFLGRRSQSCRSDVVRQRSGLKLRPPGRPRGAIGSWG